MNNNNLDTYKTIVSPGEETLLKEKKSKFYGYAFPISTVDEVKPILEKLKKKHHTACHVCYAWQIGVETIRYRANDDGEPNNSAGMPIYGQIQSCDVTNILVAIVRIFGGTKLGVGGLISAYRESAQLALKASAIVERTIKQEFVLSFDYPIMDKVMRVIKQHQIEIVAQQLEMNCSYIISVRKQKATEIESIFTSMQYITIKRKE
ncbi:MAG: YigZ family protein [Cellulophaga sp.]